MGAYGTHQNEVSDRQSFQSPRPARFGVSLLQESICHIRASVNGNDKPIDLLRMDIYPSTIYPDKKGLLFPGLLIRNSFGKFTRLFSVTVWDLLAMISSSWA